MIWYSARVYTCGRGCACTCEYTSTLYCPRTVLVLHKTKRSSQHTMQELGIRAQIFLFFFHLSSANHTCSASDTSSHKLQQEQIGSRTLQIDHLVQNQHSYILCLLITKLTLPSFHLKFKNNIPYFFGWRSRMTNSDN